MTKHILAYGNPVYDRIQTPYLIREDRVLSGCSTNACLAVTKLGESATLVGSVGPDFFSTLQGDLRRYQIQDALLASAQTGGFSLLYDVRGDRELTVLGVADPIPPSADSRSGADFVLLGPILGEVGAALAESIRRTSNAPILLDPQGTLRTIVGEEIEHRMSSDFVAIARLSTVVKANELETRIVTGLEPRHDPEAAVRALHKYGCQIAVVTLAEAGSIIFDGRTITEIPPFAVDAIDPTGAGDTYAAGFMVRYLETPDDLRSVGCFASAVASVMVENSGPDFPLTRVEADRRAGELLASRRGLAL